MIVETVSKICIVKIIADISGTVLDFGVKKQNCFWEELLWVTWVISLCDEL